MNQGAWPTGFEAVDAFVEEERRRLHIPGIALAIVEGDRMVHQRGFGRARPGGDAPSPTTLFFIGSLTKAFTALAVMQLAEAGRVELEAPVQRYLPWFRVADPEPSACMTMRHLLNQTSGLPTWAGELPLADDDARPDAAERQARAWSTLKLRRPVGTAWEYSNANYLLLGLIIEAASGETYADFVQTHICGPLGMTHTTTSAVTARQQGLAVGHQFWFGQPVAAPNLQVPLSAVAAGGLISTTADMGRYLTMFLNGGADGASGVLSGAGLAELQREAVHFSTFGLSLGYGMGWFIDRLGPARLVWHSGTLPHFGAYLALLSEQKTGVVVLFNACQHWMNPVLTGVGMGVAARLARPEAASSGPSQPPTAVPVLGLIPWALRAQALIPIFQMASVAATLRQLRQRQRNPDQRLSGGQRWRNNLLALMPQLVAAVTVLPMLGKRRGYLKLYMPDYAWIARVCGSVALAWSGVQAGLFLATHLVRRLRRL
jgi:CubicO group peptidase (beta-lactamase class C family)